MSDMWGSILPTEFRGCGRGRRLSSLIQTTTIDRENIGSPFSWTITEQPHISTVTDYRRWIQDFLLDFDEIPPSTVGMTRSYKEFSLKRVDNIAVYFYIICVAVTNLINFLLFLPKIVSIMIN